MIIIRCLRIEIWGLFNDFKGVFVSKKGQLLRAYKKQFSDRVNIENKENVSFLIHIKTKPVNLYFLQFCKPVNNSKLEQRLKYLTQRGCYMVKYLYGKCNNITICKPDNFKNVYILDSKT